MRSLDHNYSDFILLFSHYCQLGY